MLGYYINNEFLKLNVKFYVRATMTPKDILKLLWTNVKGAFLKPYEFGAEMGEYIGGIIILGHTILLLVTVPLIGVGKTVFDISTRVTIPKDKMMQLSTNIRNIDPTNTNFDEFIKEINNYNNPCSNSSKALIDNLRNLNEGVEKKIEQHRGLKSQEISNSNYYNAIKDIPSSKFFVLQRTGSPLTSDEEKVAKAFAESKRDTVNEERRQAQKELILAYLKKSKNIGKKMQHIIMEAYSLVFEGQESTKSQNPSSTETYSDRQTGYSKS
jgi:hypothetical protein